MPLIVSPEYYELWLDPGRNDPAELAAAMRPFPPESMQAHRVGTRVNSVANNDPILIEPVQDWTSNLFGE